MGDVQHSNLVVEELENSHLSTKYSSFGDYFITLRTLHLMNINNQQIVVRRPSDLVGPTSTLYNLIIRKESWDVVYKRIKTHPQDARWINSHRRTSALHLACCMNPPVDIISALIQAYPAAVSHVQAGGRGNLPLHFACSKADTSYEVLLELLKADVKSVWRRNWNEALPVECLYERYRHDVSASMSMMNELDEMIFFSLSNLFWKKASLLLSCQLTRSVHLHSFTTYNQILREAAFASNLFRVPNQLRCFVLRLLKEHIHHHPKALCSKRDSTTGRFLLNRLLHEGKLVWGQDEGCLAAVILYAPNVLLVRDKITRLLPFMLAASEELYIDDTELPPINKHQPSKYWNHITDNCIVGTIFELLRANPAALCRYNYNNSKHKQLGDKRCIVASLCCGDDGSLLTTIDKNNNINKKKKSY